MKIKDLVGKKNILVRIAPVKGINSEYIYITAIYSGSFNVYFFDGVSCSSLRLDPNHKVALTRSKEALAIKETYELLYGNGRSSGIFGKTSRSSYIYSTGSDPEIFASKENDELIPAFLFLGSKEKPFIAPAVSYGRNQCYWDGYQAEFNTTPESCHGWHLDSIRNGLFGVKQALTMFDPEAKLSIKTTFDIPMHNLQSDAEEHVEFGCMPSKNVYGMQGIKDSGRNVPYRSAGGHIHFGLLDKSEKTIVAGVKGMDTILGVACVSLFANFDDPRRRKMYGLAGEYRTPAHGVEYRVLSNAWLSHPLITNVVLDLARTAFVAGVNKVTKDWKCDEQETIRIINECDVSAARKVLQENEKLFKAILAAAYNNYSRGIVLYKLFMEGMESAVAEPHNITKNWQLDQLDSWVSHCNGKEKNVATSFPLLKENKKVS